MSSVPELQGDMDLADTEVPGLLTSELRPARPGAGGVTSGGRGRGSGGGGAPGARPVRPLVPGTGKRRGRPPKALGAPPSARTKRSLEKFVDEADDVKDVSEVENGVASPAFHLNLAASPQAQQRLERLQQELSHYNKLSSSPFSVSLPGSPSSPLAPSLAVNIKAPGERPQPEYQRTNSLPPPAPVYTPARPVFKTPGLTPIAPKPSWAPSPSFSLHSSHQSNAFPEASNGHHIQPTLKLNPPETNGNFTVSPLENPLMQQSSKQPSHSSSSFLSPQSGQTAFAGASTSTQYELDEDYDC